MQKYTSKATSVNSKKLPAIYTKGFIPNGSIVLDIGCGAYTDHIVDYMSSKGIDWAGIDPYNYDDNEFSLGYIEDLGGAEYTVCSNVINVIDDDEEVANVIKFAIDHAKVAALFTVYEGDGSGIGRETKSDCYQRNAKLRDYLRFFPKNAVIKKNTIIINKESNV